MATGDFLRRLDGERMLNGLDAVLQVMIDSWGHANIFQRNAVVCLREHLELTSADTPDLAKFVNTIPTRVSEVRNTHFRFLTVDKDLDIYYTDTAPDISQDPQKYWFYWLAYRFQKEANKLMRLEATRKDMNKIIDVLPEMINSLGMKKVSPESLRLPAIELMVFTWVESNLPSITSFAAATIATHIIELTRQEARVVPGSNFIFVKREITPEKANKLQPMASYVYQAELNEAREHYKAQDDFERAREIAAINSKIVKMIPTLGRYAAKSVNNLTQVIESTLFPYPQKIKWIRPLIRDIYTKASKLRIFANCISIQSVNNTYARTITEGRIDQAVLGVSYLLAVDSVDGWSSTERDIEDPTYDLKELFGWNGSIDDLAKQLAQKYRVDHT